MKLNRFWVFVLAAFLSGTTGSFADTQVDAVIVGPQTWTEAGSPYRVSRDTLVTSSAVLTLEPGVVVLVSTGGDHNIPNLTPRVDLAIQGRLVINGTEAKPVKIISVNKNEPWGALFVAANQAMTWTFLDMQGGRLVVTNAQLTMDDCRVSSGEGIQVGSKGRVDLVGCQVDANLLGIAFLDASAKVNLTRTRLWNNETALYYKTTGTLGATESSISDSDKWNVVNATSAAIRIPVLWWGTTDATEITGKVFDGSRRKGIGPVSFDGVAGTDPLSTNVSGFIPNADPRKRLWKGPKYLVGLHFQWVIPELNITLKSGVDQNGDDVRSKVKFNSTLGYGGSIGWLAANNFEMRLLAQAADLTTSNPALNSHLAISFFQVGVAGRYLISMTANNSLFGFLEGGGLMTFEKENNSYPSDPTKPDQKIINSPPHNETDIGFEAGAGIMTRLGSSYKAEVGAHYNLIPLSNGRGGGLLNLQAGLSFYFR